MAEQTKEPGYFLHETANMKLENFEELFAERYWWAMRYSDRMSGLEYMPPTEIILRELNSRLLLPNDIDDLGKRNGQVPGVYRTTNVRIKSNNISFLDYKFVPDIMSKFGSLTDQRISSLDQQKRKGTLMIKDIIENAAFAMYWTMRIHPFPDGNGRVGREFSQLVLRRFGLPPVFIAPVNREEYTKDIMKVHASAPDAFKFNANLAPITSFLAERIIEQSNVMQVDKKVVTACKELLVKAEYGVK